MMMLLACTFSKVVPIADFECEHCQHKATPRNKLFTYSKEESWKRKPSASNASKPSTFSIISIEKAFLSTAQFSASAAKSIAAGTKGQDGKEKDEATLAHKVAEEEKDLRSFLSASERADLTPLIASISEVMRKTIETNFDAAATLNELGHEGRSEEERLIAEALCTSPLRLSYHSIGL